MLEFTLDPASVARLTGLTGLRRTGKIVPLAVDWHDTASADLLRDGLALSFSGGRWRLARQDHSWAAPVVLAESRDRVALGPAVPAEVVPLAHWDGTRRGFRWVGQGNTVSMMLFDGRFGRPGRAPPARLSIDGPAEAIPGLAALLAPLGARLARTSLAQDAHADASPELPSGPVPMPAEEPAGHALGGIIARQLRIMLHWADLIPKSSGPEPVHQMRVAIRRLRAALSIFRPVSTCPALLALAEPLKDCAAQLGQARDWDVFLDGAGARLAAAFPADARCAAMLRSAGRRRRVVYGALRLYLAGPEFLALTAGLAHAASARPWLAGDPQPDLGSFAAERLSGRLRRVRRIGRSLDEVPVAELHELRKDCKRLRYAAEFFQPLFAGKPQKRFVAGLSELQEELGHLNDGAAIPGLMAQLGRAERGYAAGLAEGYTAAQSATARARIGKEWRWFRDAKPFWPLTAKPEKALNFNKCD
ncbi:MAG: CHAD domain-containing protein [Janthinobacterium lividum]